jgi:hypothetical protein
VAIGDTLTASVTMREKQLNQHRPKLDFFARTKAAKGTLLTTPQ